MEFSGINSASIPDSGRPSKNKQPYIRPQATVVTPDQAQEQVNAKAAPRSQEFESCSELIAEARKRLNMIEIHRQARASSTVQA